MAPNLGKDSLPFDRSWLPEVQRRFNAYDAGLTWSRS